MPRRELPPDLPEVTGGTPPGWEGSPALSTEERVTLDQEAAIAAEESTLRAARRLRAAQEFLAAATLAPHRPAGWARRGMR